MDFLKYNLAELHNLATQGNRDQKSWLENYLKSCENSKETETASSSRELTCQS